MTELEPCETCGGKSVALFGMDQTPLCTNHLNQAQANYEAAARYMQEKREMRTDIPNEYEVKQVILIRRDLKMRRGKEIAQGAHASIAFLTRQFQELKEFAQTHARDDQPFTDPIALGVTLGLDKDAWDWIEGRFTKVVLQVFSEEELLRYHGKAEAAGLRARLIQDSGQTEFGGVPTYTTCAIGPNRATDIDEVTGDLKLY